MNYKQEFEDTMVELLRKAWHEGESEGIRRAEAEFNKGYQEGYDKGYEAGQADGEEQERSHVLKTVSEVCDNRMESVEEAYERGLNVAWEYAKKMCTNWIMSDECPFTLKQDDTERSCSTCADSDKECNDHNLHCDYSCWTPKQDDTEIRVGDEVSRLGLRSVVVSISDGFYYTFSEAGITPRYGIDDPRIKKTGRHYDIESILKQMHER